MDKWIFILISFLIHARLITGLSINPQPSDQIGAVGKPLWWHCTAQGTETLTYRWRHNDAYLSVNSTQQVLANGTLHITSITDLSAGQYQCVVSDGQQTVFSKQAILTLAYIANLFTSSPVAQTKNVGDTVTMQCAIVSVPPASITWLLAQKPVTVGTATMVSDTTSQYTIDSVTFHSMGEYICKAKNPLSGEERYSNTGLLLLQGKPSFVVSPSPQTVPEGMSALFDCQGIASPVAVTMWFDQRDSNNAVEIQTGGRYMLHSNGSLQISLVTPSDQGFYSCSVRNSWGEASKTVKLTVTGPVAGPQFTTTAVDTTVFETQTVMFQCSATGVPTPMISWWKENGDLPPTRTEYPFPGAIKLTDVQVSDAGTYTCRASNNVASVTHRVKLTVQVGPSFTVTPNPVVTVEGEEVNLHCQSVGSPQPTVTWKLPDSRVLTVPSGQISGISVRANGTLVISSTSSSHHGRYTCIATNIVSTATVSAEVTVQLPPSFTVLPTSQSVLEGDRVQFDCQATGRPLPIILWYKIGNSLPIRTGSSYELLSNNSLIVKYVRKMHEGIYQCEARNLLSIKQTTVNLGVSVPPSFQLLPRDQMVTLGSNIEIECLASGDPTPTVTWTRGGQPIIQDDNMVIQSNNTIHITGLRSSQLGSYTCVAVNSVGRNEVTADLYTFDQPTFVLAPVNSTGNLSQSLTLKCSATARNQPLYHWYRSDSNGSQGQELITIQGTNTILMSTGDLIFQSLKQSDEGWYLCRAVNSVSSVSGHAFLNVQVPPVIISVTPPLTVPVGGTAVLTCSVSGDPLPSVTWTTPGGAVASSGVYTVGEDSLSIQSTVVRTHWGQWTCTACNLLGCVNDTIQLSVEGKPALTSVSATRGDTSLVIHCQAVGSPTPTIRYYIGPTQIRTDLPPIGHTILSNGTLLVQESDISSTYQCVATNFYGADAQLLTVPSQPSTPVSTNIQSTRVTLAWTNGPVQPPVTSHIIQYRLGSVTGWSSVENIPQAVYTVDNLQPYTSYVFRVLAINAIGHGVYSNLTSMLETQEGAPSKPVGIQTTPLDNSIEVSWNTPQQINGDPAYLMYEVYYKKINTTDPEIILQHSTSNAVVLHNLDYSSVYAIKLRAGNSRAGVWSDFVTMDVEVYERRPTSAPVGVTAESKGHDKVLVEWSLTDNFTVVGYLVAHTEQNASLYTVVRVTGSSHVITGLKEKTTYKVKVAAFNRGGNGSYSQPILVKTELDVFSTAGPLVAALPVGTIIGIVGGCIGLLLLVILIVVICYQQRRLRKMDSLSLAADDEFKSTLRPNFYSNDINIATVNSAKSGIRGFYDLSGRNNDAFDGEMSTDTAYTLGPNNTALPLRVIPHNNSDVMFKGRDNPDVVLISKSPRQDTSEDSTPELHAMQDLDFELDEITSPEEYLEPSSFTPMHNSSPFKTANGHIYHNDDSITESTPRSGPHEYAEVRDGQIRTTSRSTNNTSAESDSTGIYAVVNMANKSNRRNNKLKKVMEKGANDYDNMNAFSRDNHANNMYFPQAERRRDTLQSNISRDSIGSSLPGGSSLGNIIDGSLYDTPIRHDAVRSNSIGRGQPIHVEDSTDDDYGWDNDSEVEERNALSY